MIKIDVMAMLSTIITYHSVECGGIYRQVDANDARLIKDSVCVVSKGSSSGPGHPSIIFVLISLIR